MVRRWHEEIGWRADGQYIFLKTRSLPRAGVINFFSLFLGKEFFNKKFFMTPFIFFCPKKVWGFRNSLMMWHISVEMCWNPHLYTTYMKICLNEKIKVYTEI